MPYVSTLFAVSLVSVMSLVGVAALGLQRAKLNKILILLVAFAAGALFGDAFIHLLPEAFEELPAQTVSILVISGILLFFILEKFVRWRHCHVIDNDEDHGHRSHSHGSGHVATMNLVGDGLHNFIDGALIAASFLVSPEVGIATTIAVILHEIPTEIGDFGVLLHSGMSVSRALWFNFVSALMAITGAALALAFGTTFEGAATYMLPIAAGGFVYIAGSDLIPELHNHNHQVTFRDAAKQLIALSLGIAIMLALLFLE